MPLPPNARLVAGVLLCATLFGCATPQTLALRQQSSLLPVRMELAEVPFYPQEDHQCGPAALATVLNSAGIDQTPARLRDLVYLPNRKGSLQVEIIAAIRSSGLLAYPLEPSLADLLAEVAAGNPVLVLQNLGFAVIPFWHYAVAVGFDREREEIILRSGRERRQVLPLTVFERTWARSGYWSVLALPADRLPATARESAYATAAVDLEKTGHPAVARRAYATALSRWPASLPARMGQGNTAYAAGDLSAAEGAYRQAIIDHPNEWEPMNNLAIVLSDRGLNDQALAAAELALRLSNRDSEVRATLELIRKRQASTTQ